MKPTFKRFNELSPADINFDFHLHTSQTDGENSSKEMIDRAKELRLSAISFTEHVINQCEWFEGYKKNIELLRTNETISIFIGIETKAMDFEGNMDASENVIRNSEIIVGSVHRYPDGQGGFISLEQIKEMEPEKALAIEFKTALGILKNKNNQVDILGHPFGVYSKFFNNFPEKEYEQLLEESVKSGKAIEINTRYLLNERIFGLLRKINPYVSIGSDAHNITQIGNHFEEIKKQTNQLKKINILVTAAGSAISQGIIKSIKSSSLNYNIVATDSQPHAAGLYRGDAGYIVPLAKSDKFIDRIIEICKKENIHCILIGTDYELLVFAENEEKIEQETGAKVIVSSPEIIKICDDKWLTYQFLAKNNFPIIPSCLPENVEEFLNHETFPLIIKPRIGDSSKDIFIVKNKAELDEKIKLLSLSSNTNRYLSQDSGIMIQKYIATEEEEFTSTTLVFDGKSYGTISMNREMKFGGHTTKAIVKDFPEINKTIQQIVEVLNPRGPCNLQSRIVNGIPYIFEINCRFSGTTATCSLAGFNSVEACINKVILGENIKQLKYQTGTMLRYFNEVFVPEEEISTIQSQNTLKKSNSQINTL